MGIKKMFTIINIFALIVLGTGAHSKEYPIGKTFENLFHIDFDAGKRTLPLPPGIWQLFHTKTWNDDLRRGVGSQNLYNILWLELPQEN